MSLRSARRARGRRKEKARGTREQRHLRRWRAKNAVRYPNVVVGPTIIGPTRVIAHLTPEMIRTMRRAGLLYRPPSLRGRRPRTRRERRGR